MASGVKTSVPSSVKIPSVGSKVIRRGRRHVDMTPPSAYKMKSVG
jgi:hypothetical protein